MAEDVVTRTWGYCPIVSSANFAKGFAACARLSFNYSAGGPVAQSDSIAARVTNAAAAPGRRCGLVERPQNLSCFFQVEHTPYSSAGHHMGLQHYECAAEAVEPRLTRFTVELAIAVTVVGLLFLLPNLWLLLIYLRRPRGAKGPPAEAEARKQPAAAPSYEVQKVYLSFSDVHYSVKLNSGARARAKAKLIKGQPRPPHWDLKHVLKGVSGAFAPGSLSAIMGPSGCGKSTLLDVLADRKNQGYCAGRILVNGAPRGGAVFKRVAAYVMQFDALFETLTVREMLTYTAELRLPGGVEAIAAKAAAVERVIRELDLSNVADTRIGGASRRGISGGQARRVTVGVELVTSPSVLFLDEPTTGLDAYSSLLLVRALRRLADTGRTILCTIHQPRSDIFTLFDTLLLMSAGHVGYFGPTTTIRPYLSSLGIALPDGTNPADFVVDLTYAKEASPPPAATHTDGACGTGSIDQVGGSAAAGAPPGPSAVAPAPAPPPSSVDRLVNSWLVSERSRELAETCRRLEKRTLPGMPPPIRSQSFKHGRSSAPGMSAKARPFLSQVAILTRRAYAKGLRDPDFWYRMLTIPLLQFFFYAILFAWTRSPRGGFLQYADWNPADDDYILTSQLISAKRSFLYQVLTAAVITETGVLAEAYTEQRAFRREHAAGAYSAAAYHVQWAVRLMAQGVWKAILFGSIVYWFPYQFAPAFTKFAYFLANFALLSSTGSAFSLLMISFVPDPEGAGTAHNAVISVLLQFAGFYLPACLMPPVVNIPYFISFGKFAFEGLLENEFNDAPVGSEYNYYLRNNLDPNLSRWTNLLVLAVFPFLFHVGAALFTFLWTRPQSFWMRFESKRGHAARIAKARLDQAAEVAQAEMALPEETELVE